MRNRALIVIDIQNDHFPGGGWPLVGVEEAAADAARLLSSARSADDLVVHIRIPKRRIHAKTSGAYETFRVTNDITKYTKASVFASRARRRIGFSPDRMLQARLFSYGDSQRYHLGVNHMSIPVNAPKCA